MSRRPQRIVLTRTAESNRPWRRTLETAGIEVFVLPLLRFETLSLPWDFDPTTYDWILFTSPQGVRAFVTAGLETGDARFGALGGGSVAALGACGLPDHLGARARDGAELAREFSSTQRPPARVLLPGAETRLPEPRAGLIGAGFEATEVALYRTALVPPSDLPTSPFRADDAIFFCSPSAVAGFVNAYAERPSAVAIGATTAAAAREVGFPVVEADEPSVEGMARACDLNLDKHDLETET